jgi:hypothetical protein
MFKTPTAVKYGKKYGNTPGLIVYDPFRDRGHDISVEQGHFFAYSSFSG